MTESNFKTLHKVRIIIYGEATRVIKSHYLNYIEKVKDEYKSKQSPDQIEFKRVSSSVNNVKKPRYKKFSNLPDWTEYYVINSDNEYYAANKDYTKIVKLKEIKDKIYQICLYQDFVQEHFVCVCLEFIQKLNIHKTN